MAETSGFFDAEELVDGGYDREYLAEQWANYFKLFVGNGVFSSPTNQLKVVANSGMHVNLLPGWAWINGYWYRNDSNLDLEIPANVTAATVNVGIFIQFNSANREIRTVVASGRTTPNRIAPYYELKVAEVAVGVGVTEITNAVITDTRPNSDVCGFVTGIINVIDSTDLFAQFQSIFNQFITASRTEENTFIAERNADYAAWKQGVESDHADWETNYQAEAESFRQEAESDHDDWENNFEDDAETWKESFITALENWFSQMEGQISQDAAVNLQNQINSLKYMYVQDGILYIPNTRASVNDGILIISTT